MKIARNHKFCIQNESFCCYNYNFCSWDDITYKTCCMVKYSQKKP